MMTKVPILVAPMTTVDFSPMIYRGTGTAVHRYWHKAAIRSILVNPNILNLCKHRAERMTWLIRVKEIAL